MHKNLYKFSCVLVLAALVLNSCKKNSDDVAGGISYGITGTSVSMASAGDTISIFGIGFQPSTTGNTLTINGVSTTIVTAKTNELSVIVPDAPRNGMINIKSGSQSFEYTLPFVVATAVSGNQTGAVKWTADKLYLLKGAVHFTKSSSLSIAAGTTIMGDRTSRASLTIDDGASISAAGTATSPVVFTTNQIQHSRSPGDWGGITLASSKASAIDVMRYVRIEYAGYHLSNTAGAALLVNRAVTMNSIQYIQSSYSMGDGFRSNAVGITAQYFNYLLAYGCAGNDFDFNGDSKVIAQFLIGLKDPNFADEFGSDGLLVQSSQSITVSNLTLVGPNGNSRDVEPFGPSYFYYRTFDGVLNSNAGRGVHIGGYDPVSGKNLNGLLHLYNTIVAAPWLAGISVDGALAWSNYGDASKGSIIKYTSVTYTFANSSNTFGHLSPPIAGFVFSRESFAGPGTGFSTNDSSSVQTMNFNKYNDSVPLQLYTPFLGNNNPYQISDNLSTQNYALYSRLNSPIFSLPVGSPLLTSGVFTDTPLADPFIDKSHAFKGGFGSTDWTQNWSNYSPQTTAY